MVYEFFADGFEEIEAIAPLDILRRAELEITTVSINADKLVQGAHGIPIVCDKTIDEIEDWNDLQAVILPGGGEGTRRLEACVKLGNVLRDAHGQGKLIAAICAAPSILGEMGLLQGIEATCFPGFEDSLQGATLSNLPVCQCGSFITAKGAGVALAFGQAIVGALASPAVARETLLTMQGQL